MIPSSVAATSWNLNQAASPLEAGAQQVLQNTRQPEKLRDVFNDFVGQTFYSQMLSAMRKTVEKPAYFHGGRGEEIFQAQLDQTLSEELSTATADQFTGPMFELFNLKRS